MQWPFENLPCFIAFFQLSLKGVAGTCDQSLVTITTSALFIVLLGVVCICEGSLDHLYVGNDFARCTRKIVSAFASEWRRKSWPAANRYGGVQATFLLKPMIITGRAAAWRPSHPALRNGNVHLMEAIFILPRKCGLLAVSSALSPSYRNPERRCCCHAAMAAKFESPVGAGTFPCDESGCARISSRMGPDAASNRSVRQGTIGYPPISLAPEAHPCTPPVFEIAAQTANGHYGQSHNH